MITSKFKILNIITSIVSYKHINQNVNTNHLIYNKNYIHNKIKFQYSNLIKTNNDIDNGNKRYLHSKSKFDKN